MSKIPKDLSQAGMVRQLTEKDAALDVATQYATQLKSELFGAITVTAIAIERLAADVPSDYTDDQGRASFFISKDTMADCIDGAVKLAVKEDAQGWRFTVLRPPKSAGPAIEVVASKDGMVTG